MATVLPITAPRTVPATERPASSPSAGRVPEVARAAATYAPGFGTLGIEDAQRARRLVHEVVSELADVPVVQVNRSAEQAVAFLRGSGPMPTAFDEHRPEDVEWNAYMEQRAQVERDKHLHGTGDLAGRTVYGSTQLAEQIHPIDEPNAPTRLNTGAARYGEVSLVLRPETVRDRATFTANDSFYADSAAAPLERLPDVVLERVLRDFKLARERSGESSPWQDVPAAELQQRFRQLLAQDDDAVKAALRRHLTSDSLTSRYVEAQVRGLWPSDVAEVRVELDPALAPRWRSDAEKGAAALRLLPELQQLAAELGVGLRVTGAEAAQRATGAAAAA